MDGDQLDPPCIYMLALHFFQPFFAAEHNLFYDADSGTRIDWTSLSEGEPPYSQYCRSGFRSRLDEFSSSFQDLFRGLTLY
jgi:hypothetical protein